MNKTKRKTYLNILMAVVVIASLLYVGNIYLVDKIKNLSAEVVQSKIKVENLKKQNKEIAAIKDNYREVQKKIKVISDSLVYRESIVNFIIEIESVAKKNKVDLDVSVLDKSEEPLAKDFSYIYFDIKISGKFKDVVNFLVYLENLKYYVDTENIKISSDTKSLNRALSDVVLRAKLKVYLRNKDDSKEL